MRNAYIYTCNTTEEEDEGCNAPFEEVEGLGCIFVSAKDEKKTWDMSRSACRDVNGDLYQGKGVAVLSTLSNHVKSKIGGNCPFCCFLAFCSFFFRLIYNAIVLSISDDYSNIKVCYYYY